jgi:uncharacterized membrane protein (UPF0127 family)
VCGEEVLLCARCQVADTLAARLRGLLGRRALGAGEGLLLAPAASVHTFFMRFAVDVVFLDGDGHVVGVEERVGPGRVVARRGARAILELPAGTWLRAGARVGDRVRYCRAPRQLSEKGAGDG